MGLYGGTSGLSAQNGTSRLHSYLGEKVNLYVRSTYFLKAQPSLVTMVPSVSVNSVCFEVLLPKSGCLSEKVIFCMLSSANLASSGI